MTKLSLGYRIVKRVCKDLHKKKFVEGDITEEVAIRCGFSSASKLILEINRFAQDENELAIETEDDNSNVFHIDPVIYYEVFPEERTQERKKGG